MCPSPILYFLHTQSPCVNQFGDSYHHHPYFGHVRCCNCQSSNHNVNSCPHYVISNEGFVRLSSMIETMNEQNGKFENIFWECHLSHETDLSLPSSRPDVSLCDDDESPFLLESNFVDNTPLIDLEKEIDTPLTPLPLVAPSCVSTPRDTTEGVLTLRISTFPLA